MPLRVAFVQPPQLENGRYVEAEDCCWGAMAKRVMPSIMLSCVSQMENARAWFVDLSIGKGDELEGLKAREPDALVYPVLWVYHEEMMQTMGRILPDIPHIILPFPFGYAEDIAKKDPRPFAVVNSEPEAVFAGLNVGKDRLKRWRAVSRGLTWCDQKGRPQNLGSLPNCLLDIKPINYMQAVPFHYWPYYKVVMVQVTRGCPYRCTFCIWGGSTCTDRTYQMRSAGQVAQDMRLIRSLANRAKGLPEDRPEAITLRLLSAQLTTSLKWIKQFHTLMKGAPYPFQGNVNLVELTQEKLDLLMGAGMYAASAGFEGLTDRALQVMRKAHTFEEGLRGALLLEKSGIKYKLNFRIGYGEDEQDVEEALANLQRLYDAGIRRPRVKVAPLVYYKGTEIAENPPCETMQDPRFDVPLRRMKGIPRLWNRVGPMIKGFEWGPG